MYILILIISPNVSLSKKNHAARWFFVYTFVPFGVFPSEFPTRSRKKAGKCQKCSVLPCKLASPSGQPGSDNTIEDSRMSAAVARKRCDLAKK